MVKGCFYASELVQGCSKVRFSPFSMENAPSRIRLFSVIFDLRTVIFGAGPLYPYIGSGFYCLEYWKKLPFLPQSGQSRGHLSIEHLTNYLNFDHSEVENATSSNTQGTYFLRSTYGWRGPVPNISIPTSKMSEINSFRA